MAVATAVLPLPRLEVRGVEPPEPEPSLLAELAPQHCSEALSRMAQAAEPPAERVARVNTEPSWNPASSRSESIESQMPSESASEGTELESVGFVLQRVSSSSDQPSPSSSVSALLPIPSLSVSVSSLGSSGNASAELATPSPSTSSSASSQMPSRSKSPSDAAPA